MTRRLLTSFMTATIVAIGLMTVACLKAAPVQKPAQPAAASASGGAVCPGAEDESAASIPTTPLSGNTPGEVSDYRIGQRDVLNITVEPDLYQGEGRCSKQYTVGADGIINVCVLGALKVEGRDVRQIEALIKKQFLDDGVYIAPKPDVTVLVATQRSQAVFVTGEVRTAGTTPIDKPGDMTLNHAIANAGGYSPQAGPDVYILRPRRASSETEVAPVAVDDTTAQRFRYNRKTLSDTFEDPPIQAGDTIYVPQAQMFIINGEVKASGIKVWEPCITVGDAIAMASGMTEKGSLGRSYIQRRNARGGYDRIGKLKLETLLLPKDTLVIVRSLF